MILSDFADKRIRNDLNRLSERCNPFYWGMENANWEIGEIAPRMATEDHYRKQAAYYRRSPAYDRMVELYPILQTTIESCRGEKLIN